MLILLISMLLTIHFLFIITQLLGIYGSLTMVLRLLIPRIVLAYFNHLRPHLRQEDDIRKLYHNHCLSHISRCIFNYLFLGISLLKRIHLVIIELNLLKTQDEGNDLYKLQTSRIATCIFIVRTAVCVIILSIYTVVIVRTQTMIIIDS